MNEIEKLFNEYAQQLHIIADIRAEIPALAEAEKHADTIKAQIQEYAKANGESSGSGYTVTLSTRETWDTKKLPGFAVAHPELNELKSVTVVATVKKAKG